jgi:hypothetical protein
MLGYAYAGNCREIITYVTEKCVRLDVHWDICLEHACKGANAVMIKQVINECIKASIDFNWNNVLVLVCRSGNIESIKEVIRLGEHKGHVFVFDDLCINNYFPEIDVILTLIDECQKRGQLVDWDGIICARLDKRKSQGHIKTIIDAGKRANHTFDWVRILRCAGNYFDKYTYEFIIQHLSQEDIVENLSLFTRHISYVCYSKILFEHIDIKKISIEKWKMCIKTISSIP